MAAEALKSRRVKEAIEALGDYLDDAVVIAGGISAGQVLKFEVADSTTVPSPRLTSVVWADGAAGTHVLEWDTGTGNPDVNVTGENLQGTTIFKIVDADDPAISFDGTITPGTLTKDGFTATITLPDSPKAPPFASYHAYVVTSSGQTFLLKDAVEIEAADDDEYELDGLWVASGRPGDTVDALLFLRKGKPPTHGDLHVTDASGRAMSDWRIAVVHHAVISGNVAALVKQHGDSRVVPLRITIPLHATPGAYYLVAKSPGSKSEDKIVFPLWQ